MTHCPSNNRELIVHFHYWHCCSLPISSHLPAPSLPFPPLPSHPMPLPIPFPPLPPPGHTGGAPSGPPGLWSAGYTGPDPPTPGSAGSECDGGNGPVQGLPEAVHGPFTRQCHRCCHDQHTAQVRPPTSLLIPSGMVLALKLAYS